MFYLPSPQRLVHFSAPNPAPSSATLSAEAYMRIYAEISGQFPIADLSLDLHWIQLPTAVLLERRKAEREAQEKERADALPANHKIILVLMGDN